MKFTPTHIPDVTIVETQPVVDERGFFARVWCQEQFRVAGLNPGVSQCSISVNRKRATLRGLHLQTAPFEEAKLVRCTAGAVYDVVVDVRRSARTFGSWFGLILDAERQNALYIPEGVAHGFLTLTDNAEVLYQISESYKPEFGVGIRWNDPYFNIDWPLCPEVISARDASYRDFIL